MNDERLKQIEERASKATPGPWQACRDHDCYGGGHEIELELAREARANDDNPTVWMPWHVPRALALSSSYGELMRREEAEFIANARTDVPELCAALREAWKSYEEMRHSWYKAHEERLQLREELRLIEEGWTARERGHGDRLNPWEQERLDFIRELLGHAGKERQ